MPTVNNFNFKFLFKQRISAKTSEETTNKPYLENVSNPTILAMKQYKTTCEKNKKYISLNIFLNKIKNKVNKIGGIKELIIKNNKLLFLKKVNKPYG